MTAIYSVPSRTAKLLAKRLSIPIFYNSIPSRYKTIIRWGKNGYLPGIEKTINTPDAIYKANNKQLTRFVLQHAQIPIPTLGADKLPCIGRPIQHTQGRNFFYCRTLQDVVEACKKGAVYFS